MFTAYLDFEIIIGILILPFVMPFITWGILIMSKSLSPCCRIGDPLKALLYMVLWLIPVVAVAVNFDAITGTVSGYICAVVFGFLYTLVQTLSRRTMNERK